MTLTEFLLARIAEDEAAHERAAAEKVRAYLLAGDSWPLAFAPTPARALARCEADRRIVERHSRNRFEQYGRPGTWLDWCRCLAEWPCPTLGDLAGVYADHPDYDESWRPVAHSK